MASASTRKAAAARAIGGVRRRARPLPDDRLMLRNLVRNFFGDPDGAPDEATAKLAGLVRVQAQAALLDLLHQPPKPPRAIDYEYVACLLAAASSARYMVEHMRGATNYGEQIPLLEAALGQSSVDGLVLEFGVYRGNTLAAIARADPRTAHGFDSFKGLPEDWTT